MKNPNTSSKQSTNCPKLPNRLKILTERIAPRQKKLSLRHGYSTVKIYQRDKTKRV
jgi:hypothetical protein